MTTLVEIILSFFATVGIFSMLWLIFGHMLFPVSSVLPLCAVIPIQGDAPYLEHTVRQLLWLRNCRLVHVRLILLDQGLSPAGLSRVSLLLSQEPSLRFTTPDQLHEHLEKDG